MGRELYTTPGVGYTTPSDYQVENKIKRFLASQKKLVNHCWEYSKDLSPDEELINLYNYRERKEKKAEWEDVQSKLKDLSNITAGGKLLHGSTIENKEDENFMEFLNSYDPGDITKLKNSSPLDYSLYAYRSILKNKEEYKKNPGALAKKVNQDLQKIQEELEKGEGYGQTPMNDKRDYEKKTPKDFDKKDHKGGVGNDDVDADLDLTSQFTLIEQIKLSKEMKKLSRILDDFVPELDGDPKFDREGDDIMKRKSKGLRDISKVPKSQFGVNDLSVIAQKTVSGQFQISDRSSEKAKKQLIYLLVDISGSMAAECTVEPFQKYQRMVVAKNICLNFAKRVLDSNTEVYYQCFTSRLHDRHFANDLESFTKLKDIIFTTNANGGNRIAMAVNEVEDFITNKYNVKEGFDSNISKLYPEILLLTDGGENLSSFKRNNPKIKLNYINLDHVVNPDLKRVADQELSI